MDDPAKSTDPAKESKKAEEMEDQNAELAEAKKAEEEDAFQKRVEDEVKKRVEAVKGEIEPSFAKAATKAKANLKDKAEMQKFEKKMIGDEAKYLCDKCLTEP